MARLLQQMLSAKIMATLLALFAGSMAVATFIENNYDTSTAKILIYNAWWFELLMFWLLMIFVFNIKKYKLTKQEKWPILVFHLAFILLFIGGAITRYWGFEGQMPIMEKSISDEIISDQTYIKIKITDGEKSITYDQDPYVLSYFNTAGTRWPFARTFKEQYHFYNKKIGIRSLNYYPYVKDSIANSATGKEYLTIITAGKTAREKQYLFSGEVKSIEGVVFSFNKPVDGAVQLKKKGSGIVMVSPFAGTYLSMKGQQKGIITDSAIVTQNTGSIPVNDTIPLDYRTLYTINQVTFIIPNPVNTGQIVYYAGDKRSAAGNSQVSMVQLELRSGSETDTVDVFGGKGITAYSAGTRINNLTIDIGYGSNIVKIPFSIRCDDFILKRYPGSQNPSSYESEVTIIDHKEKIPHHIYMNHVMDYKGYRFFQASYYPDESGTILSVNKDWWGTNITYTGYLFLFAGMIASLFFRKSQIRKINDRLKNKYSKTSLVLLLLLSGMLTQAQESAPLAMPGGLGSKIINKEHAAKFGHLLVQDYNGRIKPMNTQVLELLRKVHKKDHYKELTAEQWFLSMQLDPAYWLEQPILYVGKKGRDQLANESRMDANNYTSFLNLTDSNGQYKLEQQYRVSFSKRKEIQSNYDKEIINLTERYTIFSNIIYGYFTKIIPVRNDSNQTWRSWIYESEQSATAIDTTAYAFISLYFNALKEGLQTSNWETATDYLEKIKQVQKNWGKAIIPAETKINLEILYNRSNIFLWLMILYSFLGVSLTILGFSALLTSRVWLQQLYNQLTKWLLLLTTLSLLIHFIALGIRWYLSGHAPWSNGYEAIVFISAIGVLSGLLLYKNRNALIPAAGIVAAMIMMGFAHGGAMLDPQITPLEPVLQSYWLMVHVGIITSSYGFFGLSSIISVVTLILYTLKPTSRIRNSITELTLINEMAVEIGVFALTIGTFLGGIWANESWGRYWSWDPKETWAFISIIFYAILLHFRIVPGLKAKWMFNLAAMWMIWTVIFTYFGVNYYLTGLHSYAAGDPIPIPTWIPISVLTMLALSIISYLGNIKYQK